MCQRQEIQKWVKDEEKKKRDAEREEEKRLKEEEKKKREEKKKAKEEEKVSKEAAKEDERRECRNIPKQCASKISSLLRNYAARIWTGLKLAFKREFRLETTAKLCYWSIYFG
ncbi:hypothetical protein N7528_005153 [Penicillium herquei]|nr:hypothetical protein N7528_005153 [Penicillium herquei]